MGAPTPPWKHQIIASLGVGLLMASSTSPKAGADGFGRWETALISCRLVHRAADGRRLGSDQPCRSLRLDQNIEGLLSARFLANDQEMVFAGSLASGQQPMRCSNDGLCKPEWPTQLTVQTVASAGLDKRDLPVIMPTARLAKGQCTIQQRLIQCQALAADGEEWRAESTL